MMHHQRSSKSYLILNGQYSHGQNNLLLVKIE
jgi:hypothetical protein